MKVIYPLVAVFALAGIAYGGAQAGMQALFGIYIPYLAFAIFLVGFVLKVVEWSKSPVPFNITTTCGQQQSHPWIKQNKIDNPSTMLGVIARMFLEVFFFRSLFRGLKTDVRSDKKVTYSADYLLWAAGLAFHYSFLVILIRHMRFFMLDVILPIKLIESMDSFLQIGVPLFYTTDALLLGAVTFLFVRRLWIKQVNYISLVADYFPLMLILGIGTTGVLMRYFFKVHIVGVKQLTMGLVTLHPQIPEGIGGIFYVHVFLISVLLAYFPFSKLMHMGGVFLSPTRNMANDSRMVRHINPWNYDVHVHTYAEYEDDFREKMKSVNIPVEKE